METVTISKREFEQMKKEIATLRNTELYKRILEMQENLAKGKKYTRKDAGI